MAAKLKGLEIDTCPFVNLAERKRTQWALTREEMKTAYGSSLIWSRRSSSANEPDGHLRHSRFVALRDDKNPHDVVRENEH